MSKRYFTVVDFPEAGQEYGRYTGSYPKQAASKALSKLAQMIDLDNSNNKNFMVFTIRELGPHGKHYKYVGTRVRLHKPIVKNINGNNVYFRFRNVISDYDSFVNKN